MFYANPYKLAVRPLKELCLLRLITIQTNTGEYFYNCGGTVRMYALHVCRHLFDDLSHYGYTGLYVENYCYVVDWHWGKKVHQHGLLRLLTTYNVHIIFRSCHYFLASFLPSQRHVSEAQTTLTSYTPCHLYTE